MNTRNKDNKKALIVKKLAEKHGVKPNMVYKVLAGDRNNDEILGDYLEMSEELDNLLLQAVKKAVPF